MYSLSPRCLLIDLWLDREIPPAPLLRGRIAGERFEAAGRACTFAGVGPSSVEGAARSLIAVPLPEDACTAAHLRELEICLEGDWFFLNGAYRLWIRPDASARLRALQAVSAGGGDALVGFLEAITPLTSEPGGDELMRRLGIARLAVAPWDLSLGRGRGGPRALVERTLVTHGPMLFLWGWIWDPDGRVDALEIRWHGERRRLDLCTEAVRNDRSDIMEAYLERWDAAPPFQRRPGFAAIVEMSPDLPSIDRLSVELRISMVGGRFRRDLDEEVVARPASPSRCIEMMRDFLDEESLWVEATRRGLLAPLERLSRETFVIRTVREIAVSLEPPDISILVTMGARLDVLSCQMVELAAAEPPGAAELVYVTDAAELAETWSLACEDLAAVYGLATRIVLVSPGSTWAYSMNRVAASCRGDVLVFLHGDVLPTERDWLAVAAKLCREERIGCVGAAMRTFDGAAVTERGWTGLTPPDRDASPLPELEGGVAVPAVDGACLAIRRSRFESLEGFKSWYPGERFADVDLCLRARAMGWVNVRAAASVVHFGGEACPRETRAQRGDATEADVLEVERRHRKCLQRDRDESFQPAANAGPARRAVDRPGIDISIVIPTLNPGKDLDELLDRLASQSLASRARILVIDSESTDGTPEKVRRRGHDLRQISRARFNHGGTRNLGVRETSGALVAFLSQDAWPADDGWLESLALAFESPKVVGAYSRQRARQDSGPLARDLLAHWVASSLQGRVQKITDLDAFAQRRRGDQLDCLTFDNVSSMIRRETALEFPFRRLDFAEDRDWAYRVLCAGHQIRYVPESVVLHAHESSLVEEARRFFLDHESIREVLPGRVPTLAWGRALREGWSESRRLSRLVWRDASVPLARRSLQATRAWPRGLVRRMAMELGAWTAIGLRDGHRSARALRRLVAGPPEGGAP